MAIATRDERVRGSIIGLRRLQQSVLGRYADDHIAAMRVERISHEATTLRKPKILQRSSQLVRHERGDLVLETVAVLIRVRQVVRVRTDSKRHLRFSPRIQERPGDDKRG